MFEATDLIFRYPRGTFELKKVSIQAKKGDVIGIVGESGSGKSTLSRLLAGLLIPHSGAIRLDGEQLSLRGTEAKRHFRRSVQMVFQDPDLSLPRHLPVGVPLHDAARPHIADRAARQAKIEAMLEACNLPSDAWQRRPREMSGGQRQRVAIARAVLVSPSVLILDEPTSALDVTVQTQVLSLLNGFRRAASMAQILITHDMELALSYCDRICVMHAGRVVEVGEPQAIQEEPIHAATRALIAAIPSGDPTRRRLVSMRS